MKTLLALATLVATTGMAHATTTKYLVEPTHTYVTYEIQHFGTSTNRGRFDKKEGMVELDRTAKTGKVQIAFDIASVNTGFDAMNKHLLSEDFFNAAKWPQARFVGDKFSFEGDKINAVSGQLTLKDRTAPVTLTARNFNCYQNPMLQREVCGGDFEATIDRTQWGIDYGLDWGFPKQVKLLIQVEAVRQ